MENVLPKVIGVGRVDAILHALKIIKESDRKSLRLNWSRVEKIAPAGFAMLACLHDLAIEHRCQIQNVFIKKKFKEVPVVANLMRANEVEKLPKPAIHNQDLSESLLQGQELSLNLTFVDRLEAKFKKVLDEDRAFSCRLILNELMQNSLDHSTSERYYMFAGIWESEMHIGVLDMGITIPAKLQQKYNASSDDEFLELALKEGVTTRRVRPGGLGLFHTFEHIKGHGGTFTLMSRDAQTIRYFKNKTLRKGGLPHLLNGTWCVVRIPLERSKK